MIWFTSDLHFSHKKVIQYCNRPFKTVEEMNDGLVSLWNEAVSDDDEVYVLGDFSMNKKTAKRFTPRLKGKKHLIFGNHDECFHKPKKFQIYYDCGWSSVQGSLDMKIGSFDVVMSHFPFANNNGDTSGQERYPIFRPEDKGITLLHGHAHGLWQTKVTKKGTLMIDVGYDSWRRLLSSDDINKLIYQHFNRLEF